MMTQENDTLLAEEQKKAKANKSKKDAMIAKLVASAAGGMVAGMAAGAGAAYAAEGIVEPDPVDPTTNIENPAEPTVEERLEALEEQERIRQEQEQERQRHEEERQRHERQRVKAEEERQHTDPEKKDDDFMKKHDVKIESEGDITTGDGQTVHVYAGTVDNHQAVFMSDGQGNIVGAVVDYNDDGNPDDNEYINLNNQHITSQDMAAHQVVVPEPTTPEIEVVAVQHDVDMDGNIVDVAIVNIDGQHAMLVDSDQDSEVDLAVADYNQNGTLEEDEIRDVSASHITMPTEDDINDNNLASLDDNSMDYSNDNDITTYEV